VKYLDRDDISSEDRKYKDAIIAISDELKKKRKHVDNVSLMVQINGILGEYIFVEQTSGNDISKRFDISRIDFDLLRREFTKTKKKNLMMRDLDDLIENRLDSMLKVNPKRVDYYERYQQIIDEYNSEQDRANIEKTFMELMALANSMNQEEQRYVREGFTSDEELSLYDMLFTDDLSKEDIKVLKKVAVDLLDKIKAKISELDHWTEKQETKAEVDTLIGTILWEELPDSYPYSAIAEYRQKIYEYVYMRYKEVA
jgi:type I restriction enzyme R subunit